MKRTKKLLALLLALVMAMAMNISAFAASGTNDNNGTITINDAVSGQTYSVYQILVLESYNTESNAYSYKAVDGWSNFLSSQSDVINVDENGYVTWTDESADDATYAAFAKAALEYAKQTSIEPNQSKIAGEPDEGEEYSTVEFTGLNLGWYLVDTSLGALCSLNTTTPDATIEEKNEAPTIDKEVVEVGEGKNEPSVGDSVNFQITVTAQKGAQNYVVHDTMSNGLTFNSNSVEIKANGQTLNGNGANFNLITDTDDDCTFEIQFTQSYLDTISKATTIVITYSAMINENAVIGEDPETNSAILDYGDGSNTKIDTDTQTYVYCFDLVKTNAQHVLINGAEFALYESEEDENPIAFVNSNGTYRVATTNDNNTTTTIKVTNGQVRITGLGAGTYYLKETKAPDGYNKLTDRIKVTVDGNNKAVVTTNNDGTITYENGGIEVVNNSGSLLPSTGGMGTTVIYIAGAALVIVAGVTLVVRRRMRAE